MRFSRSPGPGGQNVNKVSTQVTLLFDVEACAVLTDAQKTLVRAQLATRMARDGRIRVVSRRERTQVRNRSAAEARLLELLTGALTVRRARRPTRPTAGSKRRRLEAKRQRSDVKRQRRSPADGA